MLFLKKKMGRTRIAAEIYNFGQTFEEEKGQNVG